MFLMVRKVFFIPLLWIFMPFDLHLAAYCTAFCTILHCILHQNALRLAPFYLAFSSKTHCILRHIALHFAANSPKTGANGGSFK